MAKSQPPPSADADADADADAAEAADTQTQTRGADRALELKVEKLAREQARVGQIVRGAKP